MKSYILGEGQIMQVWHVLYDRWWHGCGFSHRVSTKNTVFIFNASVNTHTLLFTLYPKQ